MNPTNIIKMVKRFTDQYGVQVSWNELITTINSRGKPVNTKSDIIVTAKVLLLKDKFSLLNITDSGVFGLTQDYARFILTLPDIDIKKDMVIIDNHNRRWKLGMIDWFDVSGIPVAKQASLLEVQ